MWFLTVFSLITSRREISRLFIPRAASRSTSISRSVSRRALRLGRSTRDRDLNSSISLTAMLGLISDWPSATRRMAPATSLTPECFNR